MEDLFVHLAPYMLATFRLAGVFFFAPIVASTAVPAQARALLVFALGIAVYPSLPAWQIRPVSLDLFTLAWGVAGETLIGLCIGLIMMMPVAAVQLSGLLMSQQMGFGLAQVYNPAVEAETDLLGDLLSYLALGVFLAIGGLEGTFAAVCSTFKGVPLGGLLTGQAPLELLVGVLSGGFQMALRVSLPLMAIILMETISSAFIMKTMPQMNIMSIGFATKIVLGMLAIILGLRAMDSVIADHVGAVGRSVLQWAAHLGEVVGPAGGAHEIRSN